MAELKEVYIIDAVRTPIGSFMGSLASVSAPKLGSIAIKGLLERTGVSGDEVNEVIMGNVVQAGEGQAPARQAAIFAGLPTSVECMTINKVCGSGLKSVMLAAQAIMTGDADVIIAGGMENMSQIPFYMQNARNGYKMGHQQIEDGLIKDGLWDVYDNVHMGNIAEICAAEYNITREAQDEFATSSYKKSIAATEEGKFKAEIVPVEIPQRKGDPVVVYKDEEPFKVRFDKIPALRPVFQKDGTVTAANASSLNDGASAVMVMSKEKAEALGLKPMAKIVAQASAAKDPKWFTTAPVDSIKKVLGKVDMSVNDIDIFEINEAFSVVSLAVNKLLELDGEKVNVNGGAVSLGHPIGASGARILTTLLYAMKAENKKTGLASLCIGGGEASSVIVELM
ncbi:MAG: acetyl-CoA acetyltransferase [Melioribacteraceae bacterium]|nr:MAG: acetyl-CoA acetyltransferase [Melioribacteraceae bacterium]